MDNKKEFFIIAFVKFAEIWANNNIGSNIQVDYDRLISYVKSDKFTFLDGWQLDSLDDCFREIEEMLLDGFPIWQLFVISEWTSRMLEETFAQDIKKAQEPFLCLTCTYFDTRETSIGTLSKCNYVIPSELGIHHSRTKLERTGPFEHRRECINYKIKESL